MVSFKTEISGSIEKAVEKVTQALQTEGFGVLTRIDLHEKVKEKLGKDLPPTVILGACNPAFAYEAFTANSDVASLLPCNAVVRDIGPGRVSVELVKPTSMLAILDDQKLTSLAQRADEILERVLNRVTLNAA